MPNDRLAIVYCGAAVLAMVRWCGSGAGGRIVNVAARNPRSPRMPSRAHAPRRLPYRETQATSIDWQGAAEFARWLQARIEAVIGRGPNAGNAPFSVVGVDKSRKVRENLDMYNSVVLRHDESRKNRCAS